MYTVYADGHLLYHPELVNNGYGIYTPVINYEANKSGSFQFKMPVTNVMYNSLTKMSSIITVYQDSEEIFRGRVLNDDRDYYNNKSVYVEGELAFLLDSIVRPIEWNGTIANLFAHIINSHNEQVDVSKRFTVGNCTVLADNEVTYSITDYSNSWNVLNSYLMDVYGGYIRVRLENGTRYIDYIASYNSTSDQVIRFGDNLLDFNQHISGENVITRLIPLGAAYEIEKEDSEITPGTKIIDYESEPVGNKKKDNARTYIFAMEVLINSKNKSTEKTNVTVNFKVKTEANTISWSGQSASKLYAVIKTKTDKKTTERKKTGLASASWSTNFTTICTWTGDLKTGQTTITCEFVNNYSTKDNKPVSCGMSRYVDLLQQKSTRVDITSVNDGKDYIVNSQAEALFGQITGVQVWDDTDDPTALKTKGEEYLSENIALNVTLDVNAVDLNLVNVNYEKIKIGDRIRVVSAPHVLDEYFTCTAMSIDLQNPEQNSYTLGAEYKTLTETQIVNTNKLALTNDQINDIWEAVDEMNSVTEQANELIQTIYDQYADVATIIENLEATYAEIDFANIGQAAIDTLMANEAFIEKMHAKYLEVDLANITQAAIDNLTTNYLDAVYLEADLANITQAAIDNLTTNYLDAVYLEADLANITQAAIDNLTTNHLDSVYADIDFANIGNAAITNLTTNNTFTNFLGTNYADINFAHITEAAITKIFGGTGVVSNLTVDQGQVTGYLSGVHITGDVIEANTIKADSLILSGDDGLYYEINANAGSLTPQQLTDNKYKQKIDGSALVAQSVTANQIAAHTITTNELTSSIGDDLGITTLQSTVNGISGNVSTLQTQVSGAVNAVTYRYCYYTSATQQPNDSVFDSSSTGYDSMPARVDGKYIWRRTTTTFVGGGTPNKKYEMVQGADGKDGDDSYTYIRYSANSDGSSMTQSPQSNTKYIGIYTGNSSTAPSSAGSYTWSNYVGPQGPKGDGFIFIKGTQTAATNAWTGSTTEISELYDGLQIAYWLPFAGTSTGATLNLTLSGTATGAKPCYYSGTSPITTHYAAGNIIHLTYRVNVTVGSTTGLTGWWADANYNTDTYDRVQYKNNITAASAITAKKIIVAGSNGNYFNLAGGVTFDINKQILYAGGNISSGSTGNNNYMVMPSVDLQQTVSGVTFAANTPIYIKGLLSGSDFIVDSTNVFSTAATTDDGFFYLQIGSTYSGATHTIYFNPTCPPLIYQYLVLTETDDDGNTIVTSEGFKSIYATREELSASNSRLEILKGKITSTVSSVQTITDKVGVIPDGEEDLYSQYLKTKETVSLHQTAIEQLPKSIRLTVQSETKDVSDKANDSYNKLATYFDFEADGLKIGNGSNIRTRIDNNSFDIIKGPNENIEVISTFDANEGLTAANLSVGSLLSGQEKQRWYLTAWGTDKKHFKIGKH